MDVNQAVRLAKDWIRGLYSDEDIRNVGLEEVKLDPETEVWRITIGFSRPWDSMGSFLRPDAPGLSRSFKTVNVDDKSGNVISLEARDVVSAAR